MFESQTGRNEKARRAGGATSSSTDARSCVLIDPTDLQNCLDPSAG
jgi:hypothetical protein